MSRFRCSETADLTGKDEILRSQLCLSQILLGGEISIQLASNYIFMLVAVKERKLLSKQCGKKEDKTNSYLIYQICLKWARGKGQKAIA